MSEVDRAACPELESLVDFACRVPGNFDALRPHLATCETCEAMVSIARSLFQIGRDPRELLRKGDAVREVASAPEPRRARRREPVPDTPEYWDCPDRGVLVESVRTADADWAAHAEDCITCRSDMTLLRALDDMGLDARNYIERRDERPEFLVFMDESGRDGDDRVPWFGLAALITTERHAAEIESVRRTLVSAAGLPPDTEIHADPCIRGDAPFDSVAPSARDQLLWDFICQNRRNYLFHWAPDMLKDFVKESTRADIMRRGLTEYSSVFSVLLVVLSKYIGHALNSNFRFLYDRNDAVSAALQAVVTLLRSHPTEGLRISALVGDPEALDSANSAAIQLADVIAFYEGRWGQIEIPKFDHGPMLERHRDKYERVYEELLLDKRLPLFSRELFREVAWGELGDISLAGDADDV